MFRVALRVGPQLTCSPVVCHPSSLPALVALGVAVAVAVVVAVEAVMATLRPV
jgi:hypothetical protein